jgi:hypothetical protein
VLSRPDEVAELVEALRVELAAIHRGLAELPALREEVAALRAELAAARVLERAEPGPELEPLGPGSGPARSGPSSLPSAERSADGPMVRVVRWLEQRLRRER